MRRAALRECGKYLSQTLTSRSLTAREAPASLRGSLPRNVHDSRGGGFAGLSRSAASFCVRGTDPSRSSRGRRAGRTCEDAVHVRTDPGNQAVPGVGLRASPSQHRPFRWGWLTCGNAHPGPVSGRVGACRAGVSSDVELLNRPLPREVSGWPLPPVPPRTAPTSFRDQTDIFLPPSLAGENPRTRRARFQPVCC